MFREPPIVPWSCAWKYLWSMPAPSARKQRWAPPFRVGCEPLPFTFFLTLTQLHSYVYNFTSSIIKKYNLMEPFGETQGDSGNILESCWYLWNIRLYTSALRWYSKNICSKEGQPKNPNLFEAEPKASGAQIPQISYLFGFHFDDRVIKIYHKC